MSANDNDNLVISLRVKEAKKRDIGRNIVRIDLETFRRLNLYTGEVITLIGKKESEGTVWPGYPQDNDLGIIRIDPILRKNIGTSIDETIQIRKIKGSKNPRLEKIKKKSTCEHCNFQFSLYDFFVSESRFCPNCGFYSVNKNTMAIDLGVVKMNENNFFTKVNPLKHRVMSSREKKYPYFPYGKMVPIKVDSEPDKRFRSEWFDYIGVILNRKNQLYSSIDERIHSELDFVSNALYSNKLKRLIIECYDKFIKFKEFQLPKYYYLERKNITYIIIGVLSNKTRKLILEKIADLIESLIYKNTIDLEDVNELTKKRIQDIMEIFIRSIKGFLYTENESYKPIFLRVIDQAIHDYKYGITCGVCGVVYERKKYESSGFCKSCMEKIENKSIKPKGLYQYKLWKEND